MEQQEFKDRREYKGIRGFRARLAYKGILEFRVSRAKLEHKEIRE
jgi:hypothetical protein